MKERKVQLKMRATEKEKVRIENKAKKCGLSVSEYLRKRALGYSPKALLPESFYELTEKIPDEKELLTLIEEIRNEKIA